MRKTVHSSQFTVHSQKGLTLIEVLVALTILAIGLLGVALMQVSSISGNVYSKEMATATELGQDMIEKLQASIYTATFVDSTLLGSSAPGVLHTNSELADANGNPQPNPIDGRGMATDLAGASVPLLIYTRTWTVVNDGLGANTNMKTIVATVTWTDKTGTTHTVTMEGVKVRE